MRSLIEPLFIKHYSHQQAHVSGTVLGAGEGPHQGSGLHASMQSATLDAIVDG